MANTDSPRGLTPVKHRNGAPYNGAVTPYYMPNDYSVDIFVGDPVVKTSTSNTAEVKVPGLGAFPAGMLQEVNKATAGDGNAITGVVVGFAANPSNLSAIYGASDTERVVLVCDDPDILFEVQASGTIAATDIGLNGNLIFTHSGSTVTGRSGAELHGTLNTTATFQLKVHGLVNREGNELGANAKLLVSINNHSVAHATAGV